MDGSQGEFAFEGAPLDPAAVRRFLADNPDFLRGDDGLLGTDTDSPRMTWASVGLFHRAMFEHVPVGQRLALRPLLESAIAQHRLGGSRWGGAWTDVGTPERLARLQEG